MDSNVVGRLDCVVHVIEEKRQTNTKRKREQEGDKGFAQPALRQGSIRMRGRGSDGDAIRPAVSGYLHLFLMLEECVVELLVGFELLIKAAQHDLRLALLVR